MIAARWKSVRAYQDAYHARYTEPGNAHNYGERATLLLEVLTVLMQEALSRASALASGIRRIYGVQMTDPPSSVTIQSIDTFAVWALKVIQGLSMLGEQEMLSEVIIPLVQPWLPNQQPLINEKVFNDAVAGAKGGAPISLSFDLPKNGLLDANARLKSMGLSFGNDADILPGSGIDRNQTADNFTRLTVLITTPDQTDEAGGMYRRPPVFIGNVGLHGASSGLAAVEGNAVENLSPFGTWKIDVNPLVVWKDASRQSIAAPSYSAPMKDLKLALRFYVPGPFFGFQTDGESLQR